MAFNIIAETHNKLNYEKIHRKIHADDLPFDLFPMPELGVKGGDAIGICVPLKNANEQTWLLLKPALKKLRSKFGCNVYDMYGGQNLDFFNINTFKKNMITK